MTNDTEHALRDGYRAFQRGDVDALAPLFAEDIRWHSYGQSPFAGAYVGRQAVFDLFARVAEGTDHYEQRVHDLLANDEHAVALVESTAVVDGDTFTGRAVHVHHLSNGTITEAWIQPLDHASYEAFWSGRS